MEEGQEGVKTPGMAATRGYIVSYLLCKEYTILRKIMQGRKIKKIFSEPGRRAPDSVKE
jgi:hypothetical protein